MKTKLSNERSQAYYANFEYIFRCEKVNQKPINNSNHNNNNQKQKKYWKIGDYWIDDDFSCVFRWEIVIGIRKMFKQII